MGQPSKPPSARKPASPAYTLSSATCDPVPLIGGRCHPFANAPRMSAAEPACAASAPAQRRASGWGGRGDPAFAREAAHTEALPRFSHGPDWAPRFRGSWIGASARRQVRHHRESGTVPGSEACRANGTQRVPAPLPIAGIGGRSRVGCAPNAELSRPGECRSTCVLGAGRDTRRRTVPYRLGARDGELRPL
jgi:hypothetical protein